MSENWLEHKPVDVVDNGKVAWGGGRGGDEGEEAKVE